ncbi:hypothetical protein B0H16DRAFT_1532069 [Mycena metata]|uniref:Vps41 beta-propeller domain-containing protein n=1 Tax=Mycena metata TaxID=1033252 RepID=A0AAD7NHC0_9AGAR|nr:hypothetical protein B0H16DRAFT_1532069 [Mycena metata]
MHAPDANGATEIQPPITVAANLGRVEEDEEDEEDDDEEPFLKYERIGGILPELLKKDSASALCVSRSLLALGTHGGVIHMLPCRQSNTVHMASITDVAMNETGEYVAV